MNLANFVINFLKPLTIGAGSIIVLIFIGIMIFIGCVIVSNIIIIALKILTLGRKRLSKIKMVLAISTVALSVAVPVTPLILWVLSLPYNPLRETFPYMLGGSIALYIIAPLKRLGIGESSEVLEESTF